MSKNTVRSALTPKPRQRSRRPVETAQFDAFVRRILAAYGRRVAAGDVEALRSLAQLAGEVDAVTRLAVAGLRETSYCYSWSEIAARLGVTKQTAHERYGERAARGSLDRRLLEAGLGVSVATLVAVFADHHPGSPAASVCPGCGYRYPDGTSACPTLATVRPILMRRRGEDRDAVAKLNPVQFEDLHHSNHTKITRASRNGNGSAPADRPVSLFDHASGGDGR